MQYNDIKNELSQNFIEYAVAVNTDRAIPDATSGLKPVAKRILWSTYESGHFSSKPHVKCAKIVGSVMSGYHPHGDSSIYGALTRLSQNWVMRYPLIDWHGNNGNIAGDDAAHMRYTEARLSKIAEEGLLSGIKKRNVDFIPNYDETCEEPVTLPSIFPNLLCNPNAGIGVAIACTWLPHNLIEVAAAIYDYLDGKEPSLPGPDFPTGGLIINKDELPSIVKSGHGSVKVRGQYRIEEQSIIFYEIPYNTTIEGLLNNINDVCEKKEIEGIIEIRDESNKKGLRLVIECDAKVNPETVVQQLFSKTSLQTSVSYNQVGLVNKIPTELTLKDCIKIYVDHNIECIIREAQFDLNKATTRQHIVEGLLKALEDIDNIITLIKQSESAAVAQQSLISRYYFTEAQAKAIIDMRLGKLAGLEKIELQKENQQLAQTIDELNILITNPSAQTTELKDRLAAIVRKYGDARRTEIVQLDIPKEKKVIIEPIPEPVIVTITQSGNIKRIPCQSFRPQKRGGKGTKKDDNMILETITTNTIDNLMLFTSMGKMYKLSVDKVPEGTMGSKGVNITSLIGLESNEKVVAVTSLYQKSQAQYVICITKQGNVKKTYLQEYLKMKRAKGIPAIKLSKGDSLANVIFMNDEDILILTKQGMSIRFETSSIAPLGRVTQGVRGIKLVENDEVVVGLPVHKHSDDVAIITQNGFGKKCHVTDFVTQTRGGKGIICYKPTDITGNIVGGAMIDDDDFLLLSGKTNSICFSALELPLLGRSGIGSIVSRSAITSVGKMK